MEYGLTLKNQNHIDEAAKSKKDGCYQCRGVAYKVKGGRAVLYAYNNEVIESCGAFNVVIGRFDGISSDDGLKKLKSLKL